MARSKREERDARRDRVVAVAVPVIGGALRAYRSWRARWDRSGLGGPQVVQFADGWFPGVKARWLELAVDAGLEVSGHWAHDYSCCSFRERLGHVRDRNGTTYRLVPEERGRLVVLRALFCGFGLDDVRRDDLQAQARAAVAGLPPLSVGVVERAAAIFRGDQVEVERRWSAAGPSVAAEGRPAAGRVERLRVEAARLGMDLVAREG